MYRKVSFEYCENDIVLIKTFKNVISLQDYLQSWSIVKGLRMLRKEVKGVISDFSGCQIEIEENELNDLFVFFQHHVHFVVNIKLALVIDSPKAGLVTLFKERYKVDQINVFSSKQGALDWIYSDN